MNKYVDGVLGDVFSTAELGKTPYCNYTIIGFYPAKVCLLSEATAFF